MATKKIDIIWSDLDHRLISDSLGNLKKVTNLDSVITSIDNILRTYRGSRVMLPQFASNLQAMLFEPITNTAMKLIAKEIKDTIETWDDRVSIIDLSILPDPDRSTVSISLNLMIKGHEDIYSYQTSIAGG